MKTLLRSLTLLVLLGLLSEDLRAQTTPGSPGPAFSCDGTFYQTRQVQIGTNYHSQLFRVNRNVTPAADPTTTVYTTTLVQDLATGLGLSNTTDFVVNSLAYNPLDGYLYALTYPVNNSATFPAIHLYRIGQTGVQDVGVITINGATPAQYPQLAAGVIDRNGYYYATPRNLADATNKNNLFRLNLNQPTDAAKVAAVTIPMDFYTTASPNTTVAPASTQDFSFIDIGFNPVDNTLYGIYSAGSVYKFDLTTTAGRARVTRTGAAPATAPNFGSVTFDLAGNLYAYSNEGDFYSVNITTGAATDIGNVPTAAVTDGASCVSPDQRLDVVKEVTSVVPVNGTTYDVSFAIRVKNTGTVTTTNVQVSDFLRGAANNTTFPTSTSVTISGLTVTNNGGALAANTGYTGQGANADLLTGDKPLTAGQSAVITFTARVVYASAGSVPTTAQNNSAYASSTSGTTANLGYSLQTTDGSLILPPGDVIALDQSTNSAALPSTPNGDSPSPSPVYFTSAILGNVFEDVNYGGGAGRSQATSNGRGVTGARVELFSNAGAFLGATTTDAAGNYSFINGQNGITLTGSQSYRVRVVNSSVLSTRPGSVAGLLPVQTFVNGDVNRVGGEAPNEADYGNITTGSLPASTASAAQEIQSITTVALPASGPTVGVDFGYNFSTVVNTQSSGQGSLAQFITNSNALTNANLAQAGQTAGKEVSIFMIPDGAAHPGVRAGLPSGLTNGVAVITAVTDLPAITDANTVVSGLTQTVNIGNTNTAVLGTGGKVGANGTTLDQVNGPEVQLVGSSSRAIGLDIAGDGSSVLGLAVYGFGNGLDNLTQANIRVRANNVILAQNVIGTTATSFTDPGAGRTNADGITLTAGSNAQITNNLIGYVNGKGIAITGGISGTLIQDNEISGNANNSRALDGIDIQGRSTTITGNLITNNGGNGVDSYNSSGSNTLSNNTISNNGKANGETSGIRVYGTGSTISTNLITNNYGAGISVTSNSSNNVISQNSIAGNGTVLSSAGGPATGQLGIDLLAATDDQGAGTAPYVTINDNGDADNGGNGLLNFPVLNTVSINSTNLVVSGYARPGSVVELFLASADPTGFGEGQTYLATRTEGNATDDSNTGTGSYSGTVNGLNQGTDNTNLFTFTIPLSSLTPTQRTTLLSGSAVLTSTATITGTGTSEFSGNLSVAIADVTVSLAGPTTLYAGQPTGTYTATFTNEGSATATTIARTVTLPAGATLTSAQQAAIVAAYPGAAFSGSGTVTINFGPVASLATNATSTVSFAFTAPTTVSTGLALTATTSTTSSEGADTAPDQATLNLNTVTTADVTAAITASATTTTGSFNVTFANNGPQTAAGVAYTVQLPAGLTGVTATNGGSYNAGTGLVTYSGAATTLASGSTFSSSISYSLAGSPTVPATATASVSTTTDEAGRTANNVASAVMSAAFDLTTTLSGPATTIAGSPTTLYVTTTNNGPNTAGTAAQSVTIAAGLSNVFITNGGTYNSASGVVTFPTLSNLPSGQTVTNSISLLAPATAFAPSATVSTSSGTETNTANNTAYLNGNASSTNITVTPATPSNTNESTTIVASAAVVNVGAAVTYTVTATNNGPTAASNVVEKVQLLPGLTPATIIVGGTTGTQLGSTITFGTLATYNTTTGVLTYTTVGAQAVGATTTFASIVVTAPAATGNNGQLLATASVSTDLRDNVPADNVASVVVKVRTTPDVATTITGPSTTTAGLPAAYVVKFTNSGATDAATVTETAQLPAGLTSVVVTDASGAVLSGAYNSATGLVTFPALTTDVTGSTQLFTITLPAPAQTFPVSSAIASVTSDGVATNNSAALTTTVTAGADLAVSISGPATAVVGNPITYAVTTTNNGPTTASNAVTTVQLPANLTFPAGGISSSANYNSGSGLLTFPTTATLPAGGSVVNYVTFVMPTTPSGGAISGVASVSSGTTDIVASNNTAALTTSVAPATPETADLVTSVSPATGSVVAGSPVTYTVAYRNTSGSPATNVMPTVSLPTGLSAGTLQVGGVTGSLLGSVITFNSGPAAGATYDVTTGLLTFPTLASLPVSATATSYTVSFPAPVGSGQLVVTSAVASSTTDNGLANNRANSSITINTSYDVVTSLAGPASAAAGTTNTYSVTTLNNGPSAASTTITQTVTLPAGVTATNISGGGSLSGSTITWTIPANLPAGAANEVVNTFSVVMPASGVLNLSATVASANESNAGNNTAALTTTQINLAPVAQNVWNTLRSARGNTSGLAAATGLPISPLNATDADGSIASYTIVALPATSQGVLYYNGTAATAGQTITDPTKLSFAPATGFVGNATFSYLATDNGGQVSPAALYTIPVAQDLSSTYSIYNATKGGATPYVAGDVLAQVTDLNTAVYNSSGFIYGATGQLLSGAANGLPTTGTNAVLASGSSLPTGVSLDPATGRIYVSNPSLMVNYGSPRSYTVSVTTTDIDGGTNTATVTFTIGARPLPVTLVSFTAQTSGTDAKLSWRTAQELNNDRFVVERSFDAVTFTGIGEVKGQGTTSQATDYSLVDAQVGAKAQGPVYYRLRQVDTDGTTSYSMMQVVRFAAASVASVEVYPNPTTSTDVTRLNLSGQPAGAYHVVLTDMAGRTVRTFTLLGGTAPVLNVQDLPQGSYLVTVQGNGQTFIKRLVKN